MSKHLKPAIIAAILAGVLIMPVFGLQLVRQGARTLLEPNLVMVLIAMAVVFVGQLCRDWLLLPFKAMRRGLPTLPAAPTGGNKLLIVLLVAAAVIWPFFSGRSSVDIATLVLIYVMLALGLNIVVGFAGLLDLGFVGF